MNAEFEQVFADAPLMAILRGMGTERSVRLATTAWDLGIDAVEVPLQTPEDETALREVARLAAERGKVVGAGTIIAKEQIPRARRVGPRYLVARSFDAGLVREAGQHGLPFLPGVATPSEVQAAVSLGLTWLKAFPAHWPRALARPRVVPPHPRPLPVPALRRRRRHGRRQRGPVPRRRSSRRRRRLSPGDPAQLGQLAELLRQRKEVA